MALACSRLMSNLQILVATPKLLIFSALRKSKLIDRG